MAKLLTAEDYERAEPLSRQALAFFLHSIFALGAWIAMMLVGYAINPTSVSQNVVLALSILIPLVAGNLIVRLRPDEMARHVWLAGIIWLLLVSLWILDLPTGPNACYECDATQKLARTLFSLPSPSGLIDDNGPFFGTWPAAAMIGYAIGAHLVLRRRQNEN